MSKIIVIVIIFVNLFEAVQAQKGEESISTGPVLVFPMSTFDNVATGIGLEVDGQYSFTDKSSALIQLQLTRFARVYNYYYNGFDHSAHIYLSLKGGYRYQISNSGFYANTLVGIEQAIDGYFVAGAVLGGGKRIAIKHVYFIDAGIDLGIGDKSTLNIKATFSILRRPKR